MRKNKEKKSEFKNILASFLHLFFVTSFLFYSSSFGLSNNSNFENPLCDFLADVGSHIDEKMMYYKKLKHVMDPTKAKNCFNELIKKLSFNNYDCKDRITAGFYDSLVKSYSDGKSPKWSYFEEPGGSKLFDAVKNSLDKLGLEREITSKLSSMFASRQPGVGNIIKFSLTLDKASLEALNLGRENFTYGIITNDLYREKIPLTKFVLEFAEVYNDDKTSKTVKLISIHPEG